MYEGTDIDCANITIIMVFPAEGSCMANGDGTSSILACEDVVEGEGSMRLFFGFAAFIMLAFVF